jgi:3-hydroxypropanoate dehydrogenase
MEMRTEVSAVAQVFENARTFNRFTGREVSDEVIERLYELMKWGPTSMNCQPGHYVFVRSPQAKQRLMPALLPGNRDKSLAAPVTVIVATDSRFTENLPSQFPVNPGAREMFEANTRLRQSTAFRNSTLQGAYLIVAARLLGLDCGPMSGFDNKAVDAEFFPDGRYEANFLLNIGYGDPAGNHPRGPRLPFAQAVEIL